MKITFIFKAEKYEPTQMILENATFKSFVDKVGAEKDKFESENITAYIKNDRKYMSIDNKKKIQSLIRIQKEVTVEFLYNQKYDELFKEAEELKTKIDQKHQKLKDLSEDLEDEMSKLEYLRKLSKSVGLASADEEQKINLTFVICDPLVSANKIPIYQPEVDLEEHIERLEAVSQANQSLNIVVDKVIGNSNSIKALLSKEIYQKPKPIRIVQIFTQLIRKDEEIYFSIEDSIDLGKRVWITAKELLSNVKIDLLIVVGVKATLLLEITFNFPIICVSTYSAEKNQYDKPCRDFLDNFYQSIFERNSIEASFNMGRDAYLKMIKSSENDSWMCCCLHQHAEGCNWNYLYDIVGPVEAHRLFAHRKIRVTDEYDTRTHIQKTILDKINPFLRPCASFQYTCCNTRVHTSQKDKRIRWNQENFFFKEVENKRPNSFTREGKFKYYRPLRRGRPYHLYLIIHKILNTQGIIPFFTIEKLFLRYLKLAEQYISHRSDKIKFQEIQTFQEIYKKISKHPQFNQIVMYYGKEDSQNHYIQNYQKLHEIQITKQFLNKKICCVLFMGEKPRYYKNEFQLNKVYEGYQKIYQIFKKWSYEDIKNNWENIEHEVEEDGKQLTEMMNARCQSIEEKSKGLYEFLGFLGQFKDVGFYMTPFNESVLEELFQVENLRNQLFSEDNHLPINRSERRNNTCILHLKSAYEFHFERSAEFYYRLKLEYFYISMRIFCKILEEKYVQFIKEDKNHLQLSQSTNFLYKSKDVLNKEGIFMIQLEFQSIQYEEQIQRIYKKIHYREHERIAEIKKEFIDIEKIIENFHIKRLEQIVDNANNTANSSIDHHKTAYSRIIQYLLWNIVIKSLVFYNMMSEEQVFKEKCKLFAEVNKSKFMFMFVELAKIQIFVLLKKDVPEIKAEDKIIYDSILNTKQSQLLKLLSIYGKKKYQIERQQFNEQKSMNLVNNANSIGTILTEITEYVQQHEKYLKSVNIFSSKFVLISKWIKESLKITAMKIYFKFRMNQFISRERSKVVLDLKALRYEYKTQVGRIRSLEAKEMAEISIEEEIKNNYRLCEVYLEYELEGKDTNLESIKSLELTIDIIFIPIFQFLCRKMEKKILFNQKNLIIFARARTIIVKQNLDNFVNQEPYLFSRKRNLTMSYLIKMLKGKDVKISYFSLTTKALKMIQIDDNNKSCNVMFLVLTVDAFEVGKQLYLLFGVENNIQEQFVSIEVFINFLKKSSIEMLILVGKLSNKVAQKIQMLMPGKHPLIIAFFSNKYSSKNYIKCPNTLVLNDETLHFDNVKNYFNNELYQMFLDMILIILISNITSSCASSMSLQQLRQCIEQSRLAIKDILSQKYQHFDEVYTAIMYEIYPANKQVNHVKLTLVEKGDLEDLTSQFYSSPKNLIDEPYYENIGRQKQLYNILEMLNKPGSKVISIYGSKFTGKSTLLNEICWMCQTKHLFKFGVYEFSMDQLKHNCSSILEHISFKQDKLQRFLDTQSYMNGLNVNSGLLLALDDLTPEYAKQNQDFFRKILNKPVSLIFTTIQPESIKIVDKLLDTQYWQHLRINADELSQDELYAIGLSFIKYKLNEEEMYREGELKAFNRKIIRMMRKISQFPYKNNALQNVFHQIIKNEQIQSKAPLQFNQLEINTEFLRFFTTSFDKLSRCIHKHREIKIKIA